MPKQEITHRNTVIPQAGFFLSLDSRASAHRKLVTCDCNVMLRCGQDTQHAPHEKIPARDYYYRRAEGILVGQESNHVARDLEVHGLTPCALSYVLGLLRVAAIRKNFRKKFT